MRSAFLTLFYFGAGKLGLSFAFVHASATAVWPPTGIALAAFLVLGNRVWPWIYLGALLVNVTTSGSIGSSVGIAAGNTLEGWLGAWMVRRAANGCQAFDRPHDTVKLAVLAGMISTLVSASVGVTSLSLWGEAPWESFGSIWFTWWLGDMVGALVVAPPLILWSLNPRPRWSRRKILELSLLLLTVLLSGLVVFAGWSPFENKSLAIQSLCIPPLLWAAFRFGQREITTLVLILSYVALWGTLQGYGPFVSRSEHESLLLLQSFMGVISLMGLIVGAVVSERRRTEAQIRASLEEKELLLRELHHRVKNNLQVISSLLNLQSETIGDRHAAELFRECQHRIKSMALAHETLYRTRDLREIDTEVYVRNLASYLCQSYGIGPDVFQVKVQIDPIPLNIDQAIPLGLIVTELTTNSLKHGFPDGRAGEVQIQLLAHSDKSVTLVIADNGVGFAGEPDLQTASSLGLLLVNTLVNQLGGRIQLEQTGGTKFTISFQAA